MNGLSFKELLKYKKDLNKKLSKTNGSDNINEINEKISLINEMLEEKKKYYSNQDIVKWGQKKKDALTKEEYLYASKMCEEIKDYKKLIEDEQREKIGVKKSKKGFFKKAAVIAGSLILAVGAYFGSYSIFHKKNKDIKDESSNSQIEDQNSELENSGDRLIDDVGLSESQIDDMINNVESNTTEDSLLNSNVTQTTVDNKNNTISIIETVNDNASDTQDNNNSVVVTEEVIPEVVEESSEIIIDPEDTVREGDEIPSEEVVYEETVVENAPTVDEGNMQIEEDENDVTYYNNENNSKENNSSSNNKVEEETTVNQAPEIDYDNMEIEEDEDDITYYDEEGKEISSENSAYVLTLKM